MINQLLPKFYVEKLKYELELLKDLKNEDIPIKIQLIKIIDWYEIIQERNYGATTSIRFDATKIDKLRSYLDNENELKLNIF